MEPGATVGIVGRSFGKSTPTKLVQRFYDLCNRCVDLAQVDPCMAQASIGVVLQENFLFNGSVRDNIAVVDTSAPRARDCGGEAAGAHDFMPWSCRTVRYAAGERGSSSSGL